MKKRIAISMVITGVIANTIPRWLDFSIQKNKDVYYKGQAISFFLILLSVMIKSKDKRSDNVFECCLFAAISNMLDELFFDPIHFGWNEAMVFIFAILWAFEGVKIKDKYNLNY